MAEADVKDESPDGREAGHATIDVEQLADRVYRLMLADVRLERGRNGDVDQLRKFE